MLTVSFSSFTCSTNTAIVDNDPPLLFVVTAVPDIQADYEAMKYTQLPGESDRVTFMRALCQLATKHQEIQRQQLMNEVGHSSEPNRWRAAYLILQKSITHLVVAVAAVGGYFVYKWINHRRAMDMIASTT